MRIHFSNISRAEWIYILPSVKFHIKGWRESDGAFRQLFPKNKQGFQILIHWLWFEIFIETKQNNIYYNGGN